MQEHASLTASQIGNVQPSAFSGWIYSCISVILPSSFSSISASQLNNLKPGIIGGIILSSHPFIVCANKVNAVFNNQQINKMPAYSGQGWNSTLLYSVSNVGATSGCAGFTPEQVQQMVLIIKA